MIVWLHKGGKRGSRRKGADIRRRQQNTQQHNQVVCAPPSSSSSLAPLASLALLALSLGKVLTVLDSAMKGEAFLDIGRVLDERVAEEDDLRP